jgi:tripartite-type tricarboxylate transporter receptor subunit TctC
VLTRLNAEVNRILTAGAAKDLILAGGQVPQPTTPEQFVRGTAADSERYGAVIRARGIQAD